MKRPAGLTLSIMLIIATISGVTYRFLPWGWLGLSEDRASIMIGLISLITVLSIPVIYRRVKVLFTPWVLFILLFTLFSSLSLLWTPSPDYGHYKFQSFFAFSLIPVLLVTIAWSSVEKSLPLVLWTVLVSGVLAFSNLVVNAESWSAARYSLPEVNPIWAARFFGMSLLATGALYLTATSYRSRAGWIALMACFSVALLSTGSRGPLIALLLSVLVSISIWFVLNRTKDSSRRMVIVFITGLVVVAIFSVSYSTSSSFTPTQERLYFLTEREGLDNRIVMIRNGLGYFVEGSIFGSGIGGYSWHNSGLDRIDYPHNIVIELMIEFGVIGIITVSLWITFFVVSINRLFKDRYLQSVGIIIVSLALFGILNAMFSGDLSGNHELWFFLGLLVNYCRK